MRIDTHSYIGHWPFRQLRGNTCRGLLENMDRYGVGRAIVASIHGVFYMNPQSANEELAREAKPFGKRFIPFAVLNPTYSGWETDFDICIRQLGMKGVRVYPQYHDYDLSDPRLASLIRLARERDVPVAFSLRLVDDRQRSWLDPNRELTLADVASVVAREPEARYLILHALFNNVPEGAARTLASANVVFDTIYGSGCGIVGPLAWDMAEIVKQYGADRLVFGTGAPFRDYVSPLLRIEIFREAGEAGKRMIWSENAVRALHLT